MIKVFLTKAPFLRIVLPLILGIYLGKYFVGQLNLLLLVASVVLLVFILFYLWYSKHPKYSWRFIFGIIAFVFLTCFGCVLYGIRPPISIDYNEVVTLKLQVISNVGESKKSNKYEVILKGVMSDSLFNHVGDKGLVYFSKQKYPVEFKPGQVVLLKGRLMPFTPSNVPYKFDYSAYLINNRISFRLLGYESKLLGDETASLSIPVVCANIRSSYNEILNQYGMEEEQLAIINAIFLGDKSQLSTEQKEAFSGAGAMHLLAVSGLHVGIIYLMLLAVFKRVLGKRRILIFILLVAFLWAYAFLTGFSPSVLRATIMFMVIEIGKMLKRNIGIANLLSVSMFIILLIEPLSIYSVGFWLSHCAVASIVLFYPIVNRWFYFKFPPLRWAWSMCALSMTAQLGAAPISILVFHEFPLLFVLSSLLLIPIMAPVLIFCMIIIVFGFWTVVPVILVPALSDMLLYMGGVVEAIDRCSFSSIANISFEWWHMILLYMTLIMGLISIETKTIKSIKRLSIVAILFVASLHLNRLLLPNEGALSIELNDGLIINCFNANVNEVYLDKKISTKEAMYNLSGFWSHYGANSNYRIYKSCDQLDSMLTVKTIMRKHALIVRSKVVWPSKPLKHNIDVLVLMNNANLTEEEQLLLFPNTIVIQKGAFKDESNNLFVMN